VRSAGACAPATIKEGDDPYRRLDLNMDGVTNMLDVLALAPPVFFATCTP